MKKYYPNLSFDIIIPFHVSMTIILIISSLTAFIEDANRESEFFIVFSFSYALFLGMVCSNRLTYRYSVEKNRISKYYFRKKYEYNLFAINTVIISNSYIIGRNSQIVPKYLRPREKVKCPWFTFVIEDQDITELINDKVRGEMSSYEIENKWLNRRNIIGFEYNKHVINDLLKYYNGRIYIARTVANNFQNEIDKYIQEGLINRSNIFYVNDTVECTRRIV